MDWAGYITHGAQEQIQLLLWTVEVVQLIEMSSHHPYYPPWRPDDEPGNNGFGGEGVNQSPDFLAIIGNHTNGTFALYY